MKKNRVFAAILLTAFAVAPISALAETEASRETSATVKNAKAADENLDVRMGKLKDYLRGPNKEINGVVISDGTSVQLPADIAKKVYSQTQRGSMVMITGSEENGKFRPRAITVNGFQYNIPANWNN